VIPEDQAARTVAVLVTCHNRREKTRACLVSLRSQRIPEKTAIGLWLVDDGSSDGTAEMVRQEWPRANILVADGHGYWCGGMRLAWSQAIVHKPPFLLLLNDDVELQPLALAALLRVWEDQASNGRCDTIVVGSCCDPRTREHTYGGQRRIGRHPGKLRPVLPQDHPVSCDTFQGNVVLIPDAVSEKVGGLSPFRHAMADTDYGYRATRSGGSIVVAPGWIGTCPSHPDVAVEDATRSLFERWRRLTGPKGLPVRDWVRFVRRHGGALWMAYAVSPYLRLTFGLHRRPR